MRKFLCLGLIFFSLTACRDFVAPEPERVKIELAPFPNPVMNIVVGITYSQTMNFYVPLGTAPQVLYKVDKLSGDPNLEVGLNLSLRMNEPCMPNCDRTAWALTVVFRARNEGEVIVSVVDVSTVSKPSSFKVVAGYGGGKG